jgi:PIN domain nuclease of toxin-antitoxin system
MKILLDTHAILWFFAGSEKISQTAKKLIDDVKNLKLISIASAWEMAIKQSQGKLELSKTASQYITEKLVFKDFSLLPIQLDHLELISSLTFHHRDPFDRILIAQAIIEKVPILTKDKFFENYPVQCIWNEPK